MHVRRTAVIGRDLNFIAAAQANAAVALLGEFVFGVQFEIPILRNRDQIVRLTPAPSECRPQPSTLPLCRSQRLSILSGPCR